MHGLINPLSAEQLHDQLDDVLGLILAGRAPITDTIHLLSNSARDRQLWALDWVKQLAQHNTVLAYHFTKQLPQALSLIDEIGIEHWLTESLDQYEDAGLAAAIQQLHDLPDYAQRYQQAHSGLQLDDIHDVLQHFITGLDGRSLSITSHEQAVFTDTETLFLPPAIQQFPHTETNFLLYKAMAVHLWAQTWFGTWRFSLRTVSRQYADPQRVVALFHTLERLRLDACVARLLPGLDRAVTQLLDSLSQPRIPTGWEEIAADLAQPERQVQDSFAWLEQVYQWDIPEPVCYQGELRPDAVAQVMDCRIVREKQQLQSALNQWQRAAAEQAGQSNNSPPLHIGLQHMPPNAQGQVQSIPMLFMDGVPMTPPADMQTLLVSIIQDQGCVPSDYLMGGHHEASAHDNVRLEHETRPDAANNQWLYPEWNYKTRRYQENWCWLQEIELEPVEDDFVSQTLQKYRGLLRSLRRTFEALRGGLQRIRRQPSGDELDLDALVLSYADSRRGEELSPYIYSRWQRNTRSIAVLFMVDMSGSTKGWINQAERESLVLLSEVLTLLGDQYAIYGFSGLTRRRCEIFPIKRFQDSYNQTVKQRISGIAPRDYTRMGVAVRHLTQILAAQDAHIRLLITLSDGKPDDEGDNYRGTYGIEDTRQALLEARRLGIHPFCITIDSEARTYLPHLYGDVNYVVIHKVEQLPLKIADIYRKLTS